MEVDSLVSVGTEIIPVKEKATIDHIGQAEYKLISLPLDLVG